MDGTGSDYTSLLSYEYTGQQLLIEFVITSIIESLMNATLAAQYTFKPGLKLNILVIIYTHNDRTRPNPVYK